MKLRVRFLALTIALFLVSAFLFLPHVRSATPVIPRRDSTLYEPPPPPAFFDVQPPSRTEVPEPDMNLPTMRRLQLALARICVSEAGFQIRTNDCTMIYHALRTRSSTGEITMGIMRAYAPLSFNPNRTDSHRWVAHLRSDFREPEGWSETVSIPWSAKREAFISVYNHAGFLLRTTPENPCGVRIDHWGARGFRRELLLDNGWQIVECGETLNDFWSMPVDDDEDIADNENTGSIPDEREQIEINPPAEEVASL